MPVLKIFISWSGPASKVLAGRLTEWLPRILPGVDPFFSAEIQGGAFWDQRLLENLEKAEFGILCITKENARSPWLNFEAGSLWKQLVGGFPVYPLLLDMAPADLSGPISLFQAKIFDEQGVRTLCRQLADRIGLPERKLHANFIKAWPRLEHDVKNDLSALKTSSGIGILVPSSNSPVVHRPKVKGWINDPAVPVWVIVHPLTSSTYWVQPKPSVRSNGNWQSQIYIGRDGNVNIGDHFEILAVAGPDNYLAQGMELESWPSARFMSEIVEVVRA